ncbi:Acyl carrier protein [Melia azedarach]|uniref:Acyl carrier protein n=1 Tax=Melia azedarach TaxID=155640 RepID=A0ACC1XCM2_MELAZ|nr:Acyl carrier protein [Melia azedarach]
MASFLATPACPLATIPGSRGPISMNKSFSTAGFPIISELKKNSMKIQISKAGADRFYTRSRCLKTAISCSNAQPETLKTVQSTIAKQLSIELSSVTPETKFADLGADSLDTVEIMMALEEQFGVSIGEGGAENIATVQDAAELIEKVKAAAA